MDRHDQREVSVNASELLETARERFGVEKFRRGQRALIESVMRGQDALGILPTGAGKSLTYQLPALLLPSPVLVVSPLIALMQDQHDKLAELGIKCASFNSTLRVSEEREMIEQMRAHEHALIYVTPERLENPEYLALLKEQHISLFVVDEAHCVSTWGHDFRPAYLALRDARKKLGNPPLLALTATATEAMIEDILHQLGARSPRVVQLAVERKNLMLEVVRTPRSEQRREKLIELLERRDGAGIIYVATVKKAIELSAWLDSRGIANGLYHGKLKADEREEAQRRFMSGEVPVMVATAAFGLGIDKQDLRFVVHYNFPDSLETYYQEAGRAGRDGKPARAVLLYRIEDKRLQSYFLGGKYPRRDESLSVLYHLRTQTGDDKSLRGVRLAQLAEVTDIPERRVKVIVAQLESVGIIARKNNRIVSVRDVRDEAELSKLLDEYEGRRRTDRSRLELMMRYAESAQCRSRFLNEYFGEESEQRCDHCDNCTAGGQIADEEEVDDDREARLRSAEKERLERLVASAVGNVEPSEVVSSPTA
jgi:ATP-dependent DNA helicase RecQ